MGINHLRMTRLALELLRKDHGPFACPSEYPGQWEDYIWRATNLLEEEANGNE